MNNYKKAGLISLVGATVVLSGCSTTGTSGASMTVWHEGIIIRAKNKKKLSFIK